MLSPKPPWDLWDLPRHLAKRSRANLAKGKKKGFGGRGWLFFFFVFLVRDWKFVCFFCFFVGVWKFGVLLVLGFSFLFVFCVWLGRSEVIYFFWRWMLSFGGRDKGY